MEAKTDPCFLSRDRRQPTLVRIRRQEKKKRKIRRKEKPLSLLPFWSRTRRVKENGVCVCVCVCVNMERITLRCDPPPPRPPSTVAHDPF